MMETPDEKLKKYIDTGHTELENHAKTQQKLYEEHVANTSSVTRIISEFFKTNLIAFGYHYLRSRFGKRHPYQSYPRNDDNGIYTLHPAKPITDEVSIALLSDWASDTEESDQVSHLVTRYDPDYTIHLGDIYFVGTPAEVAENFTAPHASWHYGKMGSLALAGNHEMYSNGKAFFKHLLPAMFVNQDGIKKTQQAGFFCLENSHWRILGLDTGYTSVGRPFFEVLFPPDGHLRKEQTDWLRDVARIGDPSDKRGIILLSHHPYISSFRGAFSKPGQQIRELLGEADRPVIWFWGHEHRLVLYNFTTKSNGPATYGRCIGHGGMPVDTYPPEGISDQDQIYATDNRVRKRIGRQNIGYNGFALLRLNQNKLTAEYRDLEDNKVFEEEWTLHPVTNIPEWKLVYSLT